MLATALLLLPASCIKDDYAARESTTVTLSVSTRSDYQDQNNQEGHNLEPNEEMKTLRVIVARSSNNEIIYNEFEDNIAGNDFQRTFNFSELTIETDGENFDFYAIANEAGFLNSGESLDGKDIDLNALKSRILRNDFNATDDGQIPQTAFATKEIVPETTDNFTMQLEFVVAKIEFVVVNATPERQTVNNINLSDAGTTETSLFPTNSTLNTGTEDFILNTITVNAEETSEPVTTYLYESKAGSNGYGFSAWWGEERRTVDMSSVTELPRNKKLRITATLISKATVQFTYEVLEWDDVTVDIPAFN